MNEMSARARRDADRLHSRVESLRGRPDATPPWLRQRLDRLGARLLVLRTRADGGDHLAETLGRIEAQLQGRAGGGE